MSLSLPVAPLSYPDELTSSWIGRVACRYGMTEGGLIAALRDRWPNGTTACRIDWRADSGDLAALAVACRVDPEVLRQRALTATGWPRCWFAWDGLPGGDGVAACGEIAPAFCRCCWRDDVAAGREPYLRRGWARVFGMCQTHRQPLSRACGWCGAACAPRRLGRLAMQAGLARRVCERCGHLLDQRPPPARIADPADPLWPYARQPVPLEIAMAILAAWREVAAFEGLLAAALDRLATLPGGADRAAGSLVRVVADLARLWLKPAAGEDGRPLIAGRGTPAFPVPALGSWRPRGGAGAFAVAGLAVRQAVLGAIAQILRPAPVAAADAAHGSGAILTAAWRLDLAHFVRLLDNDSRAWLECRGAGWPTALQQPLATALRGASTCARRVAAQSPSHPGRAVGASAAREPIPGDSARYRSLASAILTSAAWQQARGRSPRTRQRVLGRLMRRAAAPARPGAISHDPGAISRELGCNFQETRRKTRVPRAADGRILTISAT